MVNFIKRAGTAALVSVLLSFSAAASVSVGFRAVIGTDTSGCSMIVPDGTLDFSAVRARDLTGPVTTYQIQPLQIALLCQDTSEAVIPSLTLTGTTPYTGTAGTVFLDGTANGAGFMVRLSSGSTPSLTDFYNTAEAVANNGAPAEMTTLDSSNDYYSEETLLVGLVGPLGDSVVPGPFSATLVVNVVFQ